MSSKPAIVPRDLFYCLACGHRCRLLGGDLDHLAHAPHCPRCGAAMERVKEGEAKT